MYNILISGYYGFDNIGDESILRTLVTSLRERIPDCSLTVLYTIPPPPAKNTAWRRWSVCRPLPLRGRCGAAICSSRAAAACCRT